MRFCAVRFVRPMAKVKLMWATRQLWSWKINRRGLERVRQSVEQVLVELGPVNETIRLAWSDEIRWASGSDGIFDECYDPYELDD